MTPVALEASACSATIRTSFLPSISASSLLGPPIRVERPAASTMAVTLRLASRSATVRGCGRVTISISRPPTPMPVSSARVTFSPARSRISTQSKPFSTGERAQPGAPSTGTPPALPISSRLPGSTGMPKCSMAPPISVIAAGMTSRRSAIAEAPNTITSSAPRPSNSLIDAARSASSCGTRRSAMMLAPAGREPLRRHAQRLVDHFGASPGSRVETTPTFLIT